jgi:hypothetical protein
MGVGPSSLTRLSVPMTGSDNPDWRVEEQMLRMPVSNLQTLAAQHIQLLKTMGRILQVRGEKVPPEIAPLVNPNNIKPVQSIPATAGYGMGGMGGIGMGYDSMPIGSTMGYGYGPGPYVGGKKKRASSKKAASPKASSSKTATKKK